MDGGGKTNLRTELLDFPRAQAYTQAMTTRTQLESAAQAALAALLEAVAAEAQPLLAEHRPSRIVINFSGGDKVRIETARFRDVSVGPPAK